MGYCMHLQESDFRIEAAKAEEALRAIKSLDPDHGSGGSYNGGRHIQSYFAWVDTHSFMGATDLGEAFGAWRWGLNEGPDGSWILSEFVGEKLGDDNKLFDAVAPYVTPGSYIEMLGEDGSRWRWVFDGQTCEERSAKVIWE